MRQQTDYASQLETQMYISSLCVSYCCWVWDTSRNTANSIVFQNIERAFGMLIKRFPRLQLLNQKTLRKKIKVIMAACVLHNICIMENDNIQFYLNISKRVCIQDIKYYKHISFS